MRSRILSAAATVVLASSGLVAATAAPASATSCVHTHRNLDGATGVVIATTANVRIGPHHAYPVCRVLVTAVKGDYAYYDCWTRGSLPDTGYYGWDWVYLPRYGISGWINSPLLSNGGSTKYCGD